MRQILFATLLLTCLPALAAAQEPTPADTTRAEPADTVTGTPVGPVAPDQVGSTYEPPNARNALFKSLVVPGWGQLSVGSPIRAGVYFGIGVTSWTMLIKTLGRLDDAEMQVDDRVAFVSDSLRAEMALDTVLARELADPEVFDALVESDSIVDDKQQLVRARRQQRQDWIAYTLFFTFLNAVDAYVAAQLVDFPGDLDIGRRADGATSIGVRIPAGAGRR